jgi:hypothetical protein
LDYHSTRKIGTFYNKRVISKKLVTIFARHLDSFTVTQNLSSVYQLRKTGSGHILQPGQFNLSPGLAKIAPWCLAHRDSLLAKVPGLESAGCATNAFCSYPLAVRFHCQRLPDCLLLRQIILTLSFRPSIRTSPSTKYTLTCPACPDAHLPSHSKPTLVPFTGT